MADEQLHPDSEPDGDAPGRLANLMPKLKVGGIMLAIVVAECAVAYVLIPSASDASMIAEGIVEGNIEEMEATAKQAAEEAKAVREIDLERHLVTIYQDEVARTLRIEFKLFGTVLEKEADEFTLLYEERMLRVKEQINLTVRTADFDALNDPRLGLLRRQILEKINRTLGKPYLRSVGFGDFSMTEQ